ncbi:uncharacterized protein LOC132902570 [Amyelois transitella]|uniref:uncharacterized protein LOC132902570 n=1 Tax=Amyelois transitella TaxID=680683 RepID=UPI00298F7690|nr:uncharacterized protein LOC132902570 [Amyelois transitella]
MTFVIRVVFATALVYTVNAGVLTGHHHDDTYVSSALSAPSASYGTPATSYGPPAISGAAHLDSHVDVHSDGGLVDDALAHGPISHTHADVGSYPDAGLSAVGPSGYTEGSLNLPTSIGGGAPLAPALPAGLPSGSGLAGPLPATLPALGSYAPAFQGGLNAATAVGPPRVIGTTVSVGRPIASASRYELQSVIQDVVRRVPVEVTRHVQVAVPHAVPVPVRQEVKVPVPQPYPVHVDVVKHVPYPVYKTQHVEVERPVPVEVVKHVPVEIIRKVPVPVDKPYEVIKKIHVPIEKHVHVPYAVWKPYPLHIVKHVTHYKKKSCCW